MEKDWKTAEDMTIAELEALTSRKKREMRHARVLRLQRAGRILTPEPPIARPRAPGQDERGWYARHAVPGRHSERRNNLLRLSNHTLLMLELVALLGFSAILLRGFLALQVLNREMADRFAAAPLIPTPLIRAVVLPSGHTPPSSPGGARFNQEEIPKHLRPIAQSLSSIPIPTPGSKQARRIFISKLWASPKPVVQGDGWEQLKKGVAQHIGSANPGEIGNLVLSAHNDIYGELFRDLDQLVPGDEIRIFTTTNEYLYRITGTRIVEPTEVSVMEPTSRPTITLISCYPYLIDTQRIVVF